MRLLTIVYLFSFKSYHFSTIKTTDTHKLSVIKTEFLTFCINESRSKLHEDYGKIIGLAKKTLVFEL